MTEENAAGKPAWKRCPKCRGRVWNDPIDWDAHQPVCPAVLEKQIERLAKRIVELERRPEPVAAELVTLGPSVDYEAVDEDEADEADAEAAAGIFAEVTAYQPVAPAIDEYDDDDEDEEPLRITSPVMR